MRTYLLIGVIVYIPIMIQVIRKQDKKFHWVTLVGVIVWSWTILLWPFVVFTSLFVLKDILFFWKRSKL